MGCGPSQNQVEPTIVAKDPKSPKKVKSVKKSANATEKSVPAGGKSLETAKPPPLTINTEQPPAKPIAFEIAADELRSGEVNEAKILDPSIKGNSQELAPRPKLTSQAPRDSEELRAKLEAKEKAVEANRERELAKIQNRLAQQEEHAKKVKERKKAMQGQDGASPEKGAPKANQRPSHAKSPSDRPSQTKAAAAKGKGKQ